MDEQERVAISLYSDGFLYVLEDGTRVYTMSTDVVAHEIVPDLKASDINTDNNTIVDTPSLLIEKKDL